MRLSYAVINPSITSSSSINAHDFPIRWAWFAIVIEAQAQDGIISGLTPWQLSCWARCTVEQAEAAMQIFLAPDVYSGCKLEDGRRLVPTDVPNQYRVVSYEEQCELITKSRDAARKRLERYKAGRSGTKRDTPDKSGQRMDGSGQILPPSPPPSPTPPQNPERDRAGAPAGAENRPPPDPWPGTADAAVIEAAGRLRDQIDLSPLKQKPTDQILIALVTSYGEALIVETLGDCGGELAGKGWKYLEAILQSRKERPNERPGQRRSGGAPSQPANGARRLTAAELGMRTGEDALRELAAKRALPKV